MQILEDQINDDHATIKEVRMFLQQLSMPFHFLTHEAKAMEQNLIRKEQLNDEQDSKGDHKYFQLEKKYEARFDAVAS